ncbi:DsbA family protein [soil metagenome]
MYKRSLVIALAGLIFTAGSFAAPPPPPAPPQSPKFNPGQTKEIENIVHDYLVKHPQVVVEVFQILQDQQQAQSQQRAQSAIQVNSKQIFETVTSPVVGNPQGKVNIVEFLDYQCGHCKKMQSTIDKLIQSNPELRVVIKELPIFGGESEFAAKAALAAQKQGKFYPMHNALLQVKEPLTQDRILKIAAGIGLNTQQLQADMNSEAVLQELKGNVALEKALELVGTPVFIVGSNNKTPGAPVSKTYFVPGEVSNKLLQRLIGEVLAVK